MNVFDLFFCHWTWICLFLFWFGFSFFFSSICIKHLNISSHGKGPNEGKEVLTRSNSEYFFQIVFEKLVI